MRLLTVLLLISISPAFAQSQDKSIDKYYPFYDNAKDVWGYADSLGNILIKPQFKDVKGFYQGFALAKAKTGWGVINEKAAWVVKPTYYGAENLGGSLLFYVDEKTNETKTKFIVDGKIVDATKDPDPDSYSDIIFEEAVFSEIDTDLPNARNVKSIFPEYDSVTRAYTDESTFYGSKNGVHTIIHVDKNMRNIFECPWKFNALKKEFPIGRVDNIWYLYKWTGKEFTMTTIATDVDDIYDYVDYGVHYLSYRKNNLVGVIVHDEKNDRWIRVPADFKTLERRLNWFSTNTSNNSHRLFDVTLPNGKKGMITGTGVRLFK